MLLADMAFQLNGEVQFGPWSGLWQCMGVNLAQPTNNAADRNRLNAFEMDMYRRMMTISWTEHRTNTQQKSWNHNVASWQKLRGENCSTSATWFELKISARTT